MAPRIGIVGLGSMGTNHASRLVDAGAEIVGADVIGEARTTFETEFDARTYEHFGEMYDAGLDGVVITVPNAFHEELTVAALERDIHVLVEKPLAHTLESAERITAAAADSDAFCAVGLVMRYYEAVSELLARVDEGRFGTVQHVEARYVRRNGTPTSGWFVDPELAGGGALIDVGVHVLDLAMAVLGFPDIEGVYGRVRSEQNRLDVEDSASGLVRCESDQTIGLEVSWAANCDPERSIVVRGDEGGASLDIGTQTLRVFPNATDDAEPVSTETSDWLAPEDEAFLAAVERGTPPSIGSLEQALAVQRVLDCFYRSDGNRQVTAP